MANERHDRAEKPHSDSPIPGGEQQPDKRAKEGGFSKERPALEPTPGPVDQAPTPTSKPEKDD